MSTDGRSQYPPGGEFNHPVNGDPISSDGHTQSCIGAALTYQHASVKRDRWVAAALDTLASEVPLDVLAKCSPNGESDDSASTQ